MRQVLERKIPWASEWWRSGKKEPFSFSRSSPENSIKARNRFSVNVILRIYSKGFLSKQAKHINF